MSTPFLIDSARIGAIAADSIAPAFSSSSTYAVGAFVTHGGALYRCTTAVTTAGAWNAANWTATDVLDEIGGAQADVGLSVVSGKVCITYTE